MKTVLRATALAAVAAGVVAGCIHHVPGVAAQREAIASEEAKHPETFWNSATVYFLLIDRFLNGDTSNDHALGRAHDGAVLRSFEGGDLKGVLQALRAGYFDSLGVNVIWMTPFEEQVRGSVDEGWGKTYAYHGYWTRDWTAVDPAFGTKDDLRAVVDEAHRRHIRVLMDAVINHTGPVTPLDSSWGPDWVRPGPNCTYRSYATTVDCNLVPTLPDIRTESDAPVQLPGWLVDEWRQEGRLDAERASLDSFFVRTGYPRAPRYYLIKWLTDWVREFGFDGYRMDTAKHFGESVAAELKQQADVAFADWKRANPGKVLDNLPFYMVGEVYGWDPSQGRRYNYGDSTVDFFGHGYDGLINFAFKRDAAGSLDSLDTRYSSALHGGPLSGVSFLNYISSHDDGQPYDQDRKDPLGAAVRLLLAPGGAQIYYGDETARPLRVAGAQGDANLRSFMNWSDLRSDSTRRILAFWRMLGRFRKEHPAVGAGIQHTLQASPYVFARILTTDSLDDRVVVAMNQPKGVKHIPVASVFANGTLLTEAYSDSTVWVKKGVATVNTPYDLVLLSQFRQSASDTVVVFVTNDWELPMEVYAIGSNTSYRMGTVNPGIPSRFVLRSDVMSTDRMIQFVAHATAYGRQAAAEPILITPGDVIDFEITSTLIGTHAAVRP